MAHSSSSFIPITHCKGQKVLSTLDEVDSRGVGVGAEIWEQFEFGVFV